MRSQLDMPAGSTFGMIAGGQIGGFFTEAALRMGYKVAVWDPDINAPAKRFSTKSFTGDFRDEQIFDEFADTVSAVSLEWENVPSSLIKALEKTVTVRPGSKSLSLAQDRITEKGFLIKNKFPVTEYTAIESLQDISKVTFGFPWIIKTATLGYDGHGQWYINNMLDIESSSTLHDTKVPMVVEKVVQYKCELSVVVAVDNHGEAIAYPPTENRHENGILKMSISPAMVSERIQKKAIQLGTEVVRAINDPGVFCVEMFLTINDDLLVNEIAPRPHNSGHHTIDAFSISQYEYQVRILAGLPLRRPIMTAKSVLLNILGEEYTGLTKNGALIEILKTLDAKVYLYGKTTVRQGRKMGHIVFCGTSLEELIIQAEQCQKIMTSGNE